MAENSLEQKRAASALKVVRDIEKEEYNGKFRSYVERLPASIVMNGLGQAMTSELAAAGRSEEGKSDGKAHKRLFDEIQRWLIKERKIFSDESDLISAIVNGTQDQYVIAQAEVLKYLEWIKKFSQAFLKKEE